MQNFDFSVSSFDITGCGQYHLMVFCGSDGVTLLVKEITSGKVLACRYRPFRSEGVQFMLRKIREIFSEEEMIHQSFGQVTIFLNEKQLVLVPEPFYSAKMAENLLPTVKKHGAGWENVTVPVPGTGSYLVFRTGKELYEYLALTFPGAGFKHGICPLLHQSPNEETGLRFHLHDSWFYVIFEESGMLRMANSFEYRSVNDMLYFMLAADREFNTGNHPGFLSGWMESADPRLAAIRKYFPGMIWAGEAITPSEPAFTASLRSFCGLFRGEICG